MSTKMRLYDRIFVDKFNPVLNSFESVKMSQTLYLKAMGPFFVRP